MIIQSLEELDGMRVAGRIAAEAHDMLVEHIEPGVTSRELNDICADYVVNAQRAVPAMLHLNGYPASISVSVNHQVIHGIPGERALSNGDIVGVQLTVRKDGYHGNRACTYIVGQAGPHGAKLVQTGAECLERGVRMVRPSASLGDIGYEIQRHAESEGLSVVREYCGSGIGRVPFEDPQVLNYGQPGSGMIVQAGQCFTIYPIVTAGQRHVKLLKDGWTVVTKDRSLAAVFGHTVVVTEGGVEVLTTSNHLAAR